MSLENMMYDLLWQACFIADKLVDELSGGKEKLTHVTSKSLMK